MSFSHLDPELIVRGINALRSVWNDHTLTGEEV
jgi:hypothetical protein